MAKKEPNEVQEEHYTARVTVTVPPRLHRHWLAEAKREGTTVSEIVRETLRARFGEPKE